MRKGYGRWRRGRWWFYLDTDHLAIGRSANEHAVVYSLLGLVAEHYRPEGYSQRMADAALQRRIRRWQDIRNQIWRNTEWQVPPREGEPYDQWAQRRWRHTCLVYEGRAADARALGEEIPDIQELRVWAPEGVPPAAYNNWTGETFVDGKTGSGKTTGRPPQ
jgi:Tfp pilus assembly pilus retraction ATPase PilT